MAIRKLDYIPEGMTMRGWVKSLDSAYRWTRYDGIVFNSGSFPIYADGNHPRAKLAAEILLTKFGFRLNPTGPY